MARPSDRDIRPPMVIKIDNWPARDRLLWNVNTKVGDDLDDPAYIVTKKPHTIASAAKGWGRFLAVLRDLGRLETDASPTDRVTRRNVNDFVRALRTAGNKGNSVALRLFELRAALKILGPGRDGEFAWIVRPHGQCAWTAFRSEKKRFPTFNPQALMQFGIGMMAEAAVDLNDSHNRVAYRNGLIFAVDAATGLRLGSMAALRLGDNLRRIDSAWHLDLAPCDIKTSQSLAFDLWGELTPWIDRYVAEVRPLFGASKATESFWVIEGGGPLGYRGIDAVIRRVSPRFHGAGFGSHTFRRSVGTAGPLANPTQPGATAGMLGISADVLEKHYNLGSTAEVAILLQEAIMLERTRGRRYTNPR